MRKFRHNKRGQIRVIEAFFAAILMLSSLTLIPTVQKISSNSNSLLSSKALNMLSSLDNDGHLGTLIDQRNWTALQSCVEALVSPAVWFNLTVFDENYSPINDMPICSGGAMSDHIEVAEYLCASIDGTYSIYDIRLQLAGLD
jgi:hypothetical protein